MSNSPNAIFLSYASQDADAARRICEALRTAGLEVWFDQSELRGGDAWDQSIRKQIKECALFVPLISANTQARAEGYFRLEWRLADQRTHLMAKGIPFILPVTIDGTSEAGALVPEAFMDVQWTKLSDEASIAAFATRVTKLVDGGGAQAIKASSSAPNSLPRTGSGGEFANRGTAKATVPHSRARLSGENWIAIVSAVFGIGAGVWFMVNGPVFQQKKRDPATAIPTPTQATSTAPATSAINPLSVMVMPFANQTGDAQKAYIADALTSSITGDLSRIRNATIIPTATAFSLADKKLTIPQLGKEAAVRFVLTGNVTANNEKLRISAALSDTQSGAQLWAENFDGQATDLFSLQDQVTTRIGNTIGTQMVIVAARESEKRANKPEVADLLMRARALSLNQQSLANSQAMEALYRQGLALEPNNPAAKAGLASSIATQSMNFGSALELDATQLLAMLKQAATLAEEVKQVDPNNPAIYPVLAIYANAIGDLAAELRAARRRVELTPNDSNAYGNLARALISSGDTTAAKVALEKSIQLASSARRPAEAYSNLAWVAFIEDKPNDVVHWAQKSADANPNWAYGHMWLALGYAQKGNEVLAKKAGAGVLRVSPNMRFSTLSGGTAEWPGKEAQFRAYIVRLKAAWLKAGLPE